MARLTETERILAEEGRELKRDEPSIVTETRRKKGEKAALAQERAILLRKARKRGARIPAAPRAMAARRMLARVRGG